MSIFHKTFVNQSYDTPEKIELLKPFMYKLVDVPSLSINVQTPPDVVQLDAGNGAKSVVVSNQETPHRRAYFPDKKDTLFWSIFIGTHGVTDYEMIHHGYSNVEIAEKHKIMMFVKERPNRLKNTNVKLTNVAIQEIISDVVTNESLNISTLVALAMFYRRRIVLSKDNAFYIDICPEEIDEPVILLIKNRRGAYGVDLDDAEQKIKIIETEQFCLHRFDKPLQAISNYTVDELKTVARRLNVDANKKQKKAELYQECVLRCVW